jgi:hypothetical protein
VTSEPAAVGEAPAPLGYHAAVVARLRADEPAAWSAVSAAASPDTAAVHADLTRNAYRLDPEGHPRVRDAAGRAAKALGVERPVTAFQLEGGGPANAALVTLPSAVTVVFGGPLLELVDDDELAAVFGHELAHHVLWSLAGAQYLIADRLLDTLAADATSPPAYAETARRYALATELYADRGALIACGDLHTAVSALVKVATGLREVDAAAYLRQAEGADPASGSRGHGHPETVLRAWALARWHQSAAAGDHAASTLLTPSLDLDSLDLIDRAALGGVTRALLADLLADSWWRTEAVVAQARQYFPDLDPFPTGAGGPAPPAWGTPVAGSARVVPATATPNTRRYLGYVLLDLVASDPDLDDEEAVRRALTFAHRVGLGAELDAVARAELSLSPAAWRRVTAGVVKPSAEPPVAPSAEPPGEPPAGPPGAPSAEPSVAPSAETPGEPPAEPPGEPRAEPHGAPSAEPSVARPVEPSVVRPVGPSVARPVGPSVARPVEPSVERPVEQLALPVEQPAPPAEPPRPGGAP